MDLVEVGKEISWRYMEKNLGVLELGLVLSSISSSKSTSVVSIRAVWVSDCMVGICHVEDMPNHGSAA